MSTAIISNNIPAQPAQADPIGAIFIRLRLPRQSLAPILPVDCVNLPALRFLAEALRLDLAGRGLDSQVFHFGSINFGFIMVRHGSLRIALDPIQQLLERLDMTPWSCVYWFDTREEVFRPVTSDSDPDAPFGFDQIAEEIRQHTADLMQAKAIMALATQYLKGLAATSKPESQPPSQNPS